VPADGSAPAVRLNVASPAPVSTQFDITPDGTRVVFIHRVGAVTNLYSAPIDGSAPAKRLNPVLRNGRQVSTFDIDPSGRVLYVADQAAFERFQLYRVPVDGSERAWRVNPLFGPTADIDAAVTLTPAFAYTPDGNEVLYRADQEWDESFELFASFIGPDGDKKHPFPAPTSQGEVETLAAATGHDRSAPLSPSSASLRAAPLPARTPPGARLSYYENELGGPRGQNVLRDHEELIRLGVHSALQGSEDGKSYRR